MFKICDLQDYLFDIRDKNANRINEPRDKERENLKKLAEKQKKENSEEEERRRGLEARYDDFRNKWVSSFDVYIIVKYFTNREAYMPLCGFHGLSCVPKPWKSFLIQFIFR